MPNFLNSICTVPKPDASGMGNSPPARKRASCPVIATSVGSASVLASWFCSSSDTTTENGKFDRPEKKSEKAFWKPD